MVGLNPEFAPAKINLSLHVTGQREDGYHLLESLVVFADVGDFVTITPSARDELKIDGPFAAGLENGAGNLVAKARDRLRAAFDFPTVEIQLTKNLPIASGIGGGSSDAAATLRGLSKLFDISPTLAAEIAIGLGADVPMCLAAKPLIASGIGEHLAAVQNLPALDLVLVNPNVAVSTPDVFKRLSNRNNPALPLLPAELNHGDFAEWLSRTRNDLQLPALQICPAIGDMLISLAETQPLLARMSGSGATCFGLFADATLAKYAAEVMRARHPGWWVVAVKTQGKTHG